MGERPPSAEPDRRVRGARVLVVDDDEPVRRVLIATLTRLGYEAYAADGGETALSVLGRTPDVAVLLSDVGLAGGMSGVELARRARQKNPTLAVLLMSGYPSDMIDTGTLASSVEVVSKPLSREALAEALERVLARRREALRRRGVPAAPFDPSGRPS